MRKCGIGSVLRGVDASVKASRNWGRRLKHILTWVFVVDRFCGLLQGEVFPNNRYAFQERDCLLSSQTSLASSNDFTELNPIRTDAVPAGVRGQSTELVDDLHNVDPVTLCFCAILLQDDTPTLGFAQPRGSRWTNGVINWHERELSNSVRRNQVTWKRNLVESNQHIIVGNLSGVGATSARVGRS